MDDDDEDEDTQLRVLNHHDSYQDLNIIASPDESTEKFEDL
jgi:hypothetical protein